MPLGSRLDDGHLTAPDVGPLPRSPRERREACATTTPPTFFGGGGRVLRAGGGRRDARVTPGAALARFERADANNDGKVTTNGHAYCTGLDTDPQGNFYYVKCADNSDHGAHCAHVERLERGEREPRELADVDAHRRARDRAVGDAVPGVLGRGQVQRAALVQNGTLGGRFE